MNPRFQSVLAIGIVAAAGLAIGANAKAAAQEPSDKDVLAKTAQLTRSVGQSLNEANVAMPTVIDDVLVMARPLERIEEPAPVVSPAYHPRTILIALAD